MPNPYGQRVNTRHSNGLSVKEFWVYLLQENERRWAQAPGTALTDEQLAQRALEAFPDRTWSKNLVAAARHRAAYNRGLLTKGEKPNPPSCRYEIRGDCIIRYAPGGHVVGAAPIQGPHHKEQADERREEVATVSSGKSGDIRE